MHIDVIDSDTALAKLQDNWNAVYDADPDAHIFLSWTWLRGWVSYIRGPWLILAARSSADAHAPYVAFFPIRLQAEIDASGVSTEVRMAGNFAADYTGLISTETDEGRAIAAFSRHIKRMNWTRLNLENLRMSERRVRLLMAQFPKATFNVSEPSRINKVDGIDNSLCPYATLPDNFEDWLQTLSTNTRQKLRRLLRQVDNGGAYRITLASADTFARDIDILMQFWKTKWLARKRSVIDGLVHSNTAMLTRSFQSGILHLPVLWHEDRPVAALATLADARKHSFLFYITGRDESFDGAAAGLMLHAFSIRYAIANGYTEYDFLRGNEPYKASFSAQQRKIRYVLIGNRASKGRGEKIDPRQLPGVLEQATRLHQDRKLAEAESGYRAVLDVQPKNPDALHRLGQLLTTREDFTGAKNLFRTLVSVRPDAVKAWLCLAQACVSLGQHSEAIAPFMVVMRLQPDLPEGFAGMAQALARVGQLETVSEALLAMLGESGAAAPRSRATASSRDASKHRDALH